MQYTGTSQYTAEAKENAHTYIPSTKEELLDAAPLPTPHPVAEASLRRTCARSLRPPYRTRHPASLTGRSRPSNLPCPLSACTEDSDMVTPSHLQASARCGFKFAIAILDSEGEPASARERERERPRRRRERDKHQGRGKEGIGETLIDATRRNDVWTTTTTGRRVRHACLWKGHALRHAVHPRICAHVL